MTSRPRPVAIIGHRGCAAEAPENTLASIRRAWDQSADAVEIDVHLTRDDVIVAHHDFTTKKTAGIDRPIAQQTLAELKALDVGLWKGDAFAGERIPTLDEVLATIPAHGRLFIEVKCGDECLPAFLRVLEQSPVPLRRLVVISFHRAVIREIKRARPELEAAWIVEIRPSAEGHWEPPFEEILTQIRELGADGVDFGYSPPLSHADVQRFHDAGLKVYIWTVNTLEAALGLEAAGVDGITTDRPGSLRAEMTHARR